VTGRTGAGPALAIVLAAAMTSGAEGPVLSGGRNPDAQEATLSNGRIAAEFGPRGLVSLTDRERGHVFGFATDAFAITLEGERWSSESLPDPVRTADSLRIRYAWSAGGREVEVVYELRPGWRFVSKRLVVAAAPAGFTVDDIVLFDARLAETPAEVVIPSYTRRNLGTGDYGAALRFADRSGLLVTAQNPFLDARIDGTALSVRYAPEMRWEASWGPFESDRGLLAPYALTGRRLAREMLPEWRMGDRDAADGLDEAEIAAYTDLVRAFLIEPHEHPVDVFVGWTANDYQIDVATAAGRAEYRRLLDRAAELGAKYVLYAPSNSALSRREESVDDWSWEHVLWLGLGQKIRQGEWDVATGAIPATVREMVGYARSLDLELLAYVYPVLPFAGNPEWIVTPADAPDRRYSNLGVRSLQDWLIETLVTFHDRTGIGGYAFDHTFLGYEGASRYAQWYGWRRVMETLRRRIPDIVIDGRQAYHLYGPWSWLAGSYPHPTYSDEQPESFVPFPDLHFDRVSADRERYTAYRYRNYDFAPSEIVPGFIGHQTARHDASGRMPSERTEDRGVVLTPIRARDWDWLGWRYSLLSSIAVAGWNNVIDMIPARDITEFEAFAPADAAWFRRWLEWTDTNREYLRNTRTILGQPALGHVDGTSAILADSGYLFLFNPNGRVLDSEFSLDTGIGLVGDGPWLLREIYPAGGRLIARPGAGFWRRGDRVSIEMDGGSAMVLEIRPAPASPTEPLLFGLTGTVHVRGDAVHIENVRDEPGVSRDLQVMLPPGRTVSALRVNGHDIAFERSGADAIRATVRFDGTRFRQYQQVGTYDPAFEGGDWSGTFTVPARVLDQLAERRRRWPIPWTAQDSLTTWLVPERLLLFVQIAEPSDSMDVQVRIDGRPVDTTRAYTAVRVARRTFVGFYADVSGIEPDVEHRVELRLPPLRPGQFQGLFFENVEPEYTPGLQAR
jgi:hypothetical protein